MSRVDRWPSTPMKLITAWVFSVVFFIVSLVIILKNLIINDTVFYTLAGVVFGQDAVSAYQFHAKRKTAFSAADADPDAPTPPPVVTKSEAVQPKGSGQPADPAPTTSADAEGEE